jgi:hypothetical protein
MGERLLCKQEVAGSIPAGSIPEVPASVHISQEATLGGDGPCSTLVFPASPGRLGKASCAPALALARRTGPRSTSGRLVTPE